MCGWLVLTETFYFRHMFGADPEEIAKENWQPYHPSDNRNKQPSKETTSASNTYNHQLPFDSYNPKYNNNPEGQGFQDHWKPSENSNRQRGVADSHSSSSTTLPKKIRSTTTLTIHKHKRKKSKSKRVAKNGRKNKSLPTELRPPPAQIE